MTADRLSRRLAVILHADVVDSTLPIELLIRHFLDGMKKAGMLEIADG